MASRIRATAEAIKASPSAPYNIVDDAGKLVNVFFREAEAASTVSVGVEAVAYAAAIADSVVMIFIVPIIIAAILLLLMVAWVFLGLAAILRNVPWVGGTMANVCVQIAQSFNAPFSALVSVLEGYVPLLWSAMITGFGYFADQHNAQTAPSRVPGNTPQTRAINQNLSKLQHEIDTLTHQINAISAHTGTPQAVTIPSNLATIPDQMRQVQYDISVLAQNQVRLESAVNDLTAQLNSSNQHISNLSQQMVGLGKVLIGWQDLVEQVQKLEKAQADVNAHQQHQIANLTGTVAELAPLAVLARPGPLAINNLRKLEDDICQCPQLGDMSNDVGSGIAIYEFVTNG